MTRNTSIVIGLGVLMASYAYHIRSGFALYHAFKLVSLLLGGHHP